MSSQGGDRISARITGGVSGQVAVGSSIVQTQSQAPPAVTAEQRSDVRSLFAQLGSTVAEQAPAALRDGAVERVEELHQAIVAEPPNPTTIRYVTRWFARKLPELNALVTTVLAEPAVGRLLQAAGDHEMGEQPSGVGAERPREA